MDRKQIPTATGADALMATAHQVNRAAKQMRLGGTTPFFQTPITAATTLNPRLIEEKIKRLEGPFVVDELVRWVVQESEGLLRDVLIVSGQKMDTFTPNEYKEVVRKFIKDVIQGMRLLAERLPASQVDGLFWERAKSHLIPYAIKGDPRGLFPQEKLIELIEAAICSARSEVANSPA
jgi:hypothetical protein